MTRPITAGVDGTEESLAALDWAAREAVRRSLALRVVHAWRFQPHEAVEAADPRTPRPSGRGRRWPRPRGPSPSGTPSWTVTTDVVEGGAGRTPWSPRPREAETLVLGSRGHGAVVGFLLGSVGQQVIAEAARPGRPRTGRRTSPAAEAAGREIVVGQQGDPEDSAAGAAVRVRDGGGARRHRARRTGLDPAAGVRLQPGLAEAPRRGRRPGAVREEGARRRAGALAGTLPRRAGHPARGDGQRGARCCCRWPRRAQLMVVGRRAHRSAVGARIGSVAHGVLHHARLPGGRGTARVTQAGGAASSGTSARRQRLAGPWAGCCRCSPRPPCPGRCRAGPARTGTSGVPGARGRSRPGPWSRAARSGTARTVGPEHLPHPAVGEHLRAGAEGVARGVVVLGGHPALQVVQEPPGLVLLGVEAGQPQQLALVVARVDDLRHEGDRVAVRGVLDLHLGHVEAEFVEAADPALDVVVLARRVDGRAGQLLPQLAGSGRRSPCRTRSGPRRGAAPRTPPGPAARR